MPTARGWLLAAATFALGISGRLFGIFELFLLAAGGFATLVCSLVLVRRNRVRLEVVRQLHPQRLHAGNPCRVELQVANRGGERTPLLTLHDPVGDHRTAVVGLGPLRSGESVGASYRLPAEQRGLLTVGPLRVEVGDPFGLVTVTTDAAPRTDLTVWPLVEDVDPLPQTSGDDPLGSVDRRHTLSVRGEDFYALRHYVVGDDLRRVHWRSTARRDDLMVRQDELMWQGRATVLLDNRGEAHTDASFERAVSAAASVAVACANRDHLVRLVTTDGGDTGLGAGVTHLHFILERLATVGTTTGSATYGLARLVVALRRPGGGGAIAALLGGARGDERETLRRLDGTYRRVVAVTFRDSDTTPFPAAWHAALATNRASSRSRRQRVTEPGG